MFRRLKSGWPPADVVRDGFEIPRFVPLRLDHFPRGIDNRHIDVVLGPALSGAAAAYIGALLREHLQRLWGQPVTSFSETVAKTFREILQEHHQAVVNGARADKRLERVQLFQLAVLKLFLGLLDSELSSVRAELENAKGRSDGLLTGHSLQLHRQAVMLGRQAGHVRYRVAHQLMRDYLRLEQGRMRNLRQSVLGTAWPVAEVMLANPLLQLDGVGTLRDFVRIYPCLLYDAGDARRVDKCIREVLSPWLPDEVAARPVAGQRAARSSAGLLEIERRIRDLLGPQEAGVLRPSWVDRPGNAVALLGGTQAHWPEPGPWQHRGIAGLQRELSRQLGSSLARAGLMRALTASYELAAVYPATGLVGVETLIFEYLQGKLGQRELIRRLDGVEGATDPAAVVRRIEDLRKVHKASAAAGRPQVLARLTGDFLRLRRDLKLAWHTYKSMDTLRLLTDEADLQASLNNNTLQVFCRESPALHKRGSVEGHVIVKAEIRGVAELSAQMRHRRLDPATHFRRHLYAPLDRLLAQFGAQKAVLEGDLLVLSLLEYGAQGAESLAVARGCCVAAGVIRLAKAMNVEHERLGLRRIEFGLGLAYAGEAPIYLYDDTRKIIVSPALQRAGTLAASDSAMHVAGAPSKGRALCVVLQPARRDSAGPTAGRFARYNVDGIELDADAFAQLNVEISLRRLSRHGKRPLTFFAGLCTDLKGERHWLVVREHRVSLWVGARLLDAGDRAQPYYEVVSDKRLIERVGERLANESANIF